MRRAFIFLVFLLAQSTGEIKRIKNRFQFKKSCSRLLAEGRSGICGGHYDPVNYEKGNINLIFAVPHDGALKPYKINDRSQGCMDEWGKCRYGDRYQMDKCEIKDKQCTVANMADTHTQKIAKLVRNEFIRLTGKTPHLVINNLYRAKMDPNRLKDEAAQGNEEAEFAFEEYHNKIKYAKHLFDDQPGLLIDFHGQAHETEITEIGYLVRKKELIDSDIPKELSIRNLVGNSVKEYKEYLFGQKSLGRLFNMKNYRAVPSPNSKAPGKNDQYFRGGYSIKQHGSDDGEGKVDAIQLEFPKRLRFNSGLRKKLSKDLADILNTFFSTNYEKQRMEIEDL